MKKIFSWTGVLWLAVIIALSSCQFFTPEKTDSITQTLGNSSEREYLAILKARDNHTVTVEELEALVSDFINPQQEGRSIAPQDKTVITGVSKLSTIGEKRFSINTAGRSAVNATEEQETVEVYNFITQKPGSDTPGYVLASNDIRVGNLLGIAEAGSLDNEELSWFSDIVYSGVRNYIDRKIDLYNSITEEEVEQAVSRSAARIIGSTASSGSVYYAYYDNYGYNGYFRSKGFTGTIVSFYYTWTGGYYAPLPVEWRQRQPYNYVVNAYKNDGINYPAGCGPVAIAQLMAFHRKPAKCTWNENVPGLNTNFNNRPYNWSSMRSGVYKTDIKDTGAMDVAVLLFEIGKRSGTAYAISYEINPKDGTTIGLTYETGIVAALRDMGYTTPSSFSPYDFSAIKISIQSNWPVLIFGSEAVGKTGHFWVIDAVRRMEYYEEYRDDNGNVWTISNPGTGPGRDNIANDWVHCNLGWGYEDVGSYYHNYNAWYVSGIFDCRGENQALARSAGTDNVYVSNLRILPNVR